MQASEATRLGEIESENAKLKKRLSEAPLHIEALKVGLITSAVGAWISRWTTAWGRVRRALAGPGSTVPRLSAGHPHRPGTGVHRPGLHGVGAAVCGVRHLPNDTGCPTTQNAYIESSILISVALSVTPSAASVPRTSSLRPSVRSTALPPENVTLPA